MNAGRRSIAVNTRFLLSNKLEGIGYFVNETMKQIVLAHPEIDFYFLFDRKYSDEFIFAENVRPVVLYPSARRPILWYIWYEIAVALWLKKHTPDLFLSPDGYGTLHTSVPQVVIIHDLAFEKYPEFLPRMNRAFCRHYTPRYGKKAARVATVSEFSKADLVGQYGLDSRKIDVVYNGVKPEYRPIDEQAQQQVRDRYAEGKEYFLYIGSIHPRKNVGRLLEAFELYKKTTGDDRKLLIAGRNMWNVEEVRTTYDRMEHKADVVFLGYRPLEALTAVTAASLAVVFVSLFEGFGVPIAEAMQSGVPVITSNTTSMPEIAGDAAVLVDPLSTKAIANAMVKVAGDPAFRQSLIEKGLQQVQQFSWDRTARLLWETCQRVLEKK